MIERMNTPTVGGRPGDARTGGSRKPRHTNDRADSADGFKKPSRARMLWELD
jgi:hypothetical protein